LFFPQFHSAAIFANAWSPFKTLYGFPKKGILRNEPDDKVDKMIKLTNYQLYHLLVFILFRLLKSGFKKAVFFVLFL